MLVGRGLMQLTQPHLHPCQSSVSAAYCAIGVLSFVCLQLLTPQSNRSTRDEAAATVFADPSKASLGAPVSVQGEQAASTVKRVFLTASTLLRIQRNGPSLHLLIVTVLQQFLQCNLQQFSTQQ